ncbi:hypothetical protein GT755_00120 [Herbidospora sp. NEAU-GS84]|uniref:Uncharacterized protein n=1 Tax=Herbidospora solisilvae TaxID=2696284 RepID=A0A7C9IZS2_9ACTN|nr:hypothetical protein [Herbidospora solisilvae]NAS20087.1 hypothetical protein [Herbidospora solisilvae]
MRPLMPVSEDPIIAKSIAQFGDEGSRAASIRYDVPLPGSYSFQRIIPLDIPEGHFLGPGRSAGTSLSSLGVVEEVDGKVRRVDNARLRDLYERMLPPATRPSLRLASEVFGRPELVSLPGVPRVAGGEEKAQVTAPLLIQIDGVDAQRRLRDTYLEGLATRQTQAISAGTPETTIQVPTPGIGLSARTVDYDVTKAGTPRIALVETWQLSMFLGDYGLGRTLQTFTLLPGERTTITVETWRSDSTSREDSSSIFDSSDTAAQTRFTSSLMAQSGSAFQDQGGWAVSVGTKASASGSIGLVSASASVEANFSANHQEARQEFSTSVRDSSQEHAAQVNTSRNQAVQSQTKSQSESGSSQTTVREIANTNLRRVLNFVFRELNQTHETVTSLKSVQVAFYNGNPGSAEVVPLARLRQLLDRYVAPDRREEVARLVLGMVTECIDHTGTPQTMLEHGVRDGGVYKWTPAELDDEGRLKLADSPLDARYSWRIASDPVGQDDQTRKVPGVVTARTSVVLRTDNIVAEALLGQADALDTYASALQSLDLRSREAEIEWRRADTRRTTDALDLVHQRPEGERVEAFEKILGDKPDIEIVPAAVAGNGNR